jgi:phytoene dehydrogenase-like protein
MKAHDRKREVVILGSGLGGLVAGTFLSKRGHSVSLLKEKGYQSFYATKDYRFTPFSSLSEKLLERRVLEELSQALNVTLPARKNEVGFQVLLPGARVDISSNRKMLQREWKREFPAELAQVEKFYEELGNLQLRARPSIGRRFSLEGILGKRIDEGLSQFSKSFSEFVRIQLISWGNFHGDRIPFTLGAYILSRYVSDQLMSGIDREELQTDLVNQFSQSGGRIEETGGVEKVDKKWRKGFTISTGDGSVLRCDCLILSMPLHRLGVFLEKKNRILLNWGRKVRPRYVLFPFFLGIREKVVPVGMKDLLASVFDIERPYEVPNPLFLSFSPRGNETEAPEGKRALTVESPMPFGALDETLLAGHQKGVMKHLNHILPFLESHMEFIDSGWGREQIPRWSYPHFGHEATYDFNWRKGIVPARIARDLYFVGKENAPYLGLEGEIRTGLKIGRLIAGEKALKDHCKMVN